MVISKEDLKDMATSENYIKFVAGKPKELKFETFEKTVEEIKEENGTVKNVPAILCKISMEDGNAVDKTLSITSKRLTKALQSFLLENKPFTATITKFGSGFDTEYEVR